MPSSDDFDVDRLLTRSQQRQSSQDGADAPQDAAAQTDQVSEFSLVGADAARSGRGPRPSSAVGARDAKSSRRAPDKTISIVALSGLGLVVVIAVAMLASSGGSKAPPAPQRTRVRQVQGWGGGGEQRLSEEARQARERRQRFASGRGPIPGGDDSPAQDAGPPLSKPGDAANTADEAK